jgi:ssDNA-binding Zn-finger/Zn-ribbon topoisomerase 1
MRTHANGKLVRRIETVRASEPCPICATPMLLDQSMHGWWLHCPGWTEGCTGKRDLDPDPGRALELLLAH